MALSRVQGTGKVEAGSVTSLAFTYGATPATGNALAVVIFCFSAAGTPFGVSGASDNQGNTWARAATTDNGSHHSAVYYCSKVITTGSPFTVTIAVTGGVAFIVGAAMEFTGTGGLTLDQTGINTGTSASPSVTTSGSITSANELLLAVHAIGANQASITAPGGWTQEVEELNFSSFEAGEGDSEIISAASGTQSITWTDASSAAWAATIATFKETGGVLPEQSIIYTDNMVVIG